MNTGSTPNSKFLLMATCVAIGMTILSGVIQGRGSNRWGQSESLQRAGQEMSKFPVRLGKWEMVSEEDMPDVVLETIEAAGYVNRTYADPNRRQARIAVLVGPPGPISVHVPEICYSSQNTKLVEKSKFEISTGGQQNSFWVVHFKPESLAATPFRVFYAFSEDGDTWSATENARLVHGGADFLYKLQLVFEGEVRSGLPDPAEDFLKAFLTRKRANRSPTP